MQLARKSARPLSPAAIIGRIIAVQEPKRRLVEASRCQGVKTTDPACGQSDGCGLWPFHDVQVQIPQELPLMEEAQDQPGSAHPRIAHRAVEFRSAYRQLL